MTPLHDIAGLERKIKTTVDTLSGLKSASDDSPPLLIAEIPRWKSSKLITPRPLGSKNLVRSFTWKIKVPQHSKLISSRQQKKIPLPQPDHSFCLDASRWCHKRSKGKFSTQGGKWLDCGVCILTSMEKAHAEEQASIWAEHKLYKSARTHS